MQSALSQEAQDNGLVTAEVLRQMTATKESIFERQKASVLDALMSSMVRAASENGLNSYTANLNPQFDPTLLASITQSLTDLGYTVATEAKNDEKLGSFISMVISW